MLTGNISFKGKTDSDVEMAIEEALNRIKAGNRSGFDSNDSGEFSFNITGSEEIGEHKCLNCGHEFDQDPKKDKLGKHVECPECESTFDVE